MTTLLAGDIGGTKTLLSLYTSGVQGLELLVSERYPSAAWEGLGPMVRHFLTSVDPAQRLRPAAACFAVAGPVQAGQARLTNLPWLLSEAELVQACAIPTVELVNDFAVLIYGLPYLEPSQLAHVRDGSAIADAPLLVLGAGTGLGVAMGIPTAQGLRAVASEAAHGSFAPRTPAEWRLHQWLQADLGVDRLSIERVVSGTGLGHVARWLLAERDPEGSHRLRDEAESWANPSRDRGGADLPAAVAAAAADRDPLAVEALALWLGAYGAVVGDLALACLSRGGIWLAGGTAAKLLDGLRSKEFSTAFLAKGRLQVALEAIPIQAITDPSVGPFSAACRARMLVT
jgi:glucokinase